LRAVRYCTGCGIDQFLDLGSGVPTVGNVHEIARRDNPPARVAYVDFEPVMAWSSQRGCGHGWTKTYPSARHDAAGLDSEDLGRRATVQGMFPLRMWRTMRDGSSCR